MSGFNDFMRLAHGRNHELERRLRESSEPRLAKIHHLIFAEPIAKSDLAMAESLASVLRTSIDDDCVISLVLDNHARRKNTELILTYYRECKFTDRITSVAAVASLLLFAFIAYHVARIENAENETLSLISTAIKNTRQ